MTESTNRNDSLPLPSKDVLTDVLKAGAQRLLAQAIQAEVDDYLNACALHLKFATFRPKSR